MKTKKQNKLWHNLLLLTSSQYREDLEYEEGENLWKKINHGLPPPEGNEKTDKQRIREFTNRFKKTLTISEQRTLTRWMQKRLNFLRHQDTEDISGYVLAYEYKWQRIYQQHLDAIH